MTDRILRVNAYTTLDMVTATATGSDGWTEDAPGVLNVTVPRDEPDHVRLELELDHTALDRLPPHADAVRLGAAEARTVARELEQCANRIDDTSD